MMEKVDIRIVLELIALIALVLGPVTAWVLKRLKSPSEVRLIDIKTIKEWDEYKRNKEKELSEAYAKLRQERLLTDAEATKRREARDEYLKIIDGLESELIDCLAVEEDVD